MMKKWLYLCLEIEFRILSASSVPQHTIYIVTTSKGDLCLKLAKITCGNTTASVCHGAILWKLLFSP